MSDRLPAPRLLTVAGVFCAVLSMSAPVLAQGPALYDGLTLDEWRDRIQQIDYQAADRGKVVPGLRALMRDPDVPWFTRRQAALTLGRLGEPAREAIGDLLELVREPVPPVETSPPLWALKALALFGPLAAEAATDAERILRDAELPTILRMTATETLARIGIASSRGIQALIAGGGGQLPASDHSELIDLQVACIEALQLPAPPSAVPMLLTACDDESERVRNSAAATLGWLGLRAEPAAERLATMVMFEDVPVVRETAARSLAKMGQRGIDLLGRLLEQPDPAVQLLALDGASRVASNRSAMARYVEPLTRAASPLVQVRAMETLWTLTGVARPLLPELVSRLEHDDRLVRKAASDTLLKMGPAARPVADQLQRLVDHGDDDTRTAAQRVLRGLEASTPDR